MDDLKVSSSDCGYALIDKGGFQPLVPEGKYSVAYIEHQTGMFFGSPKVVFRFRVLNFGEHNGVVLERFYGVKKIVGKPGKWGNFKPPLHGDFLMEFVDCFHLDPKRLDRIPLSHFERNILLAEVKTVYTNSKQSQRPKQLRYSKVARLVKIDHEFSG